MKRYKIYKKYVRLRLLLLLVITPATFILVYYLNQYTNLNKGFLALLFFLIMGGSIIITLIYTHKLMCPHCNQKSMTLENNSVNITSIQFVEQIMYVRCRSCGKIIETDLALKSNIFVKGIPKKLS